MNHSDSGTVVRADRPNSKARLVLILLALIISACSRSEKRIATQSQKIILPGRVARTQTLALVASGPSRLSTSPIRRHPLCSLLDGQPAAFWKPCRGV